MVPPDNLEITRPASRPEPEFQPSIFIVSAMEIPAEFKMQAIRSPGTPPPGETHIHRHPQANRDFSKPPMQIPPANESHVVSSVHLFRKGMAIAGANAPCLGQRFPVDASNKPGPFVFESYGVVNERAQDVAAAITASTGYKPKDDGIIGIFMNNTVGLELRRR